MSPNRDFSVIKLDSTHKIYHILLDDHDVMIHLRDSKRTRKLTLRFDQNRHHFILTHPHRYPIRQIPAFLRQYQDWIRQQYQLKSPLILFQDQEIIPFQGQSLALHYHCDATSHLNLSDDRTILHISHPTPNIGALTEKWLRSQAQAHIHALAHQKAAQLGQKISAIRIKELRSRWGSCSQRRNLNFSWRLILAPIEICDYVISHEVAHLQEMNHGPHFWRLTQQLCPHTDYSRNWLHQHGWSLHRYVSHLP